VIVALLCGRDGVSTATSTPTWDTRAAEDKHAAIIGTDAQRRSAHCRRRSVPLVQRARASPQHVAHRSPEIVCDVHRMLISHHPACAAWR